MSKEIYFLIAILLSSVVTFLLRLFPFVLMSVVKKFDFVFGFFGKMMPAGVMVILLIYGIYGLKINSLNSFFITIISLALVIFSFHFKRQALLSITLGVLCYVLLKSYM